MVFSLTRPLVLRLHTLMSAIAQLTPIQLRRAAGLKEKIVSLQKQLDALLGGTAKPAAPQAATPKKKKKRVLSPAARARIVAAQKARWAKIRSEKKKS